MILLTGCHITIEVNQITKPEDEESIYTKKATVYSSTDISPDADVPERLAATGETILRSNKVRQEILRQYPNAEYGVLDLRCLNEKDVYQIMIVSHQEENLTDICNAVAQAGCKAIEEIIASAKYCIINSAK